MVTFDLSDAMSDLKYAVENKSEFLENAKKLFDAMYKIFYLEIELADERSYEISKWVADIYMKFISKKIDILSEDLKTSLKKSNDYSAKEIWQYLTETSIYSMNGHDMEEEIKSQLSVFGIE